MADFVKKVTCPSGTHEDATPSCAVYSDGSAYCFACTASFKDLEAPAAPKPKVVENLEERMHYIDSLPKDKIRGLVFPYDNTGYYLVWPGRDYFKCRRWTSDDYSARYTSPRGHSQPLLILKGDPKALIIVEGEINALSLQAAGIKADIVSPGSAGNFKQTHLKTFLLNNRAYQTILVLVDNDVPGLQACLIAGELLKSYPGIVIKHIMERDANQVLTDEGKEKLQEEINQVGMF